MVMISLEEFGDYLLTANIISSGSKSRRLFWHYREKATAAGIKGNVDVNIYNGDLRS
jgi:lysozyme